MALYSTIHLHNVIEPRLDDYAAWFDGPHMAALASLRGFIEAHRHEVAREQLGDHPQPWRFVSVYDFDMPDPRIDIAALGPLLAEARDAGLVAADGTERIHTYRIFGQHWKGSPNWQRDKPFSGVSIILGNYVAGRYQEYQDWYENVHSVEVASVPGHVAMKRGELAEWQVEPRFYCPGDQLVMTAAQSDDLAFTIGEFIARALGRSPSGIAMEPRSTAGSIARTTHYFKQVSGGRWPGGIAYAGDWSPYGREG